MKIFSQHLSDDEASYHEDASETGTATNKPKQQQQQQLIPTTTTISNIKLLILKKEEYDIWAMEMEHYLEYIDTEFGRNSCCEKERKARTLTYAIPNEHLRRFPWNGRCTRNLSLPPSLVQIRGNDNETKPDVATFPLKSCNNKRNVVVSRTHSYYSLFAKNQKIRNLPIQEDLNRIDDGTLKRWTKPADSNDWLYPPMKEVFTRRLEG
ncbi:hypothetical protein Tco_1111258 [Tanacetum coccineum]|uniref:Uncharacterized protein n=1 Tax=Tanacetum coccineum TaxID=301880 RepID=A0ABQ5IMK7_9ASTR